MDNSKVFVRAELEKAVKAFIEGGGAVKVVKSRKSPRTHTANGKNKGAFNPNKIFSIGA
jgi:hypothetical protein